MSTASQHAKPCVPDAPGLWWIKEGSDEVGVKVKTQRAFGGRLCAFLTGGWYPVEEVEQHRWLGPVPSFEESKRHREALARILKIAKRTGYPCAEFTEEVIAIAQHALSAKGDGK